MSYAEKLIKYGFHKEFKNILSVIEESELLPLIFEYIDSSKELYVFLSTIKVMNLERQYEDTIYSGVNFPDKSIIVDDKIYIL